MTTTYRIRVQEELGPEWSIWFEGLQVSVADGGTALVGPIRDQAELHGVLARIRDLGLTLLAVEAVRVVGANPDLGRTEGKVDERDRQGRR